MNNLLGYLLKMDLAILVAVIGLAFAVWQNVREYRKDQAEQQKKRFQEVREASKQSTRIEEKLNFVGERLDRIEMWISANSGIRS